MATGQPPQAQHNCYICLQNDIDEPEHREWVSPCPCTLEAHESCFLEWVANQEQQRDGISRNGRLKCPACQAPITLIEPRDILVDLHNRLYRHYSHVSPILLVGFFTSSSVAGLAFYGLNAARMFAGPDDIATWLTGSVTSGRMFGLNFWAVGKGAAQSNFTVLAKIGVLALIGPTLVISRWLPWFGNFISVPISVLSGVALAARDSTLTWPPSPEWVITIFPLVHFSYNFLYYDMFGKLEQRLNQVLRGRAPAAAEQPPALPRADAGGAEAAAGEDAEAVIAAADAAVEAARPAEYRGVVGMFLDLVRGLVLPDGHIQVEVQVAVDPDVIRDDDHNQDIGPFVEIEWPQHRHEQEQHGVAGQIQGQNDDVGAAAVPADNNNQDQPRQQEIQIPPPLDQPAENQDINNNPDGAPAPAPAPAPQAPPEQPVVAEPPPPANNDVPPPPPPGSLSFRQFMNHTCTSLLLPTISYGMGEIIAHLVPAAWVAPPRYRRAPTGLLQMRWGRSLVGGCLFIVLRDAVRLYVKYRRAEVKQHRKVKNVAKRRPGEGPGEVEGGR
ncbi:hypothetical protein B0T17DRAFT_534638 [Bombardia bombarda]|uniref:RING-CH-type domain-containing protein n=1 Tax=Bombardia bombarda TaxID=252184 RepID=A0AA39WU51_9PEZI|nr:hypothetical protein B0T17DRAFT_534638 [Bombardia bombarda]